MLGNIAAWFTGALEGVLDVPAFTSEHDNGLIDLQCGRTVFNDVPSKMRTELWMSQLQRKRGAAAEAIARYPRLATTALHPDVISEIEKDTHRTYPKHLWLSGPVGQLSLFRILRAYAAFDVLCCGFSYAFRSQGHGFSNYGLLCSASNEGCSPSS